MGAAEVVPEPEGEDAEDDVDHGGEREGGEGAGEPAVDALDELAEGGFGHAGAEDLRVEIREGGHAVRDGAQIEGRTFPRRRRSWEGRGVVAPDADDTCGGV